MRNDTFLKVLESINQLKTNANVPLKDVINTREIVGAIAPHFPLTVDELIGEVNENIYDIVYSKFEKLELYKNEIRSIFSPFYKREPITTDQFVELIYFLLIYLKDQGIDLDTTLKKRTEKDYNSVMDNIQEVIHQKENLIQDSITVHKNNRYVLLDTKTNKIINLIKNQENE